MTREAPPNLRSLEQRLRNVAEDEQVVEARLRRAIGISVIGVMLADSGAGIIKGATNLELRIGTQQTRVSSDLDTVRRSTTGDFRASLEEALANGWAGFAGRLVDRGPINAPVPDSYRPHTFHAKLEYLGKPFGTVEIEVAPEEINSFDDMEVIEPDATTLYWLDVIGLPAPGKLPVLSLRHQIAQKLHACTTPDDPPWMNDRSHDLVDLQLAMSVFEGGLADLAVVSRRLFTYRGRHCWPPTVVARTRWSTLYPSQADGLPVLADIGSAVAWANDLVTNIDAAHP